MKNLSCVSFRLYKSLQRPLSFSPELTDTFRYSRSGGFSVPRYLPLLQINLVNCPSPAFVTDLQDLARANHGDVSLT